jgi:hypothetical protein
MKGAQKAKNKRKRAVVINVDNWLGMLALLLASKEADRRMYCYKPEDELEEAGARMAAADERGCIQLWGKFTSLQRLQLLRGVLEWHQEEDELLIEYISEIADGGSGSIDDMGSSIATGSANGDGASASSHSRSASSIAAAQHRAAEWLSQTSVVSRRHGYVR